MSVNVLLVGGPLAGRVIARPDDAYPCLVFAMGPKIGCFWLDEAALDASQSVAPNAAEYRPRSGAHGLFLHGTRTIAYHFQGEDRYARARTMERVVGFASPYSMQDLEDQAAVEFLIYECSR